MNTKKNIFLHLLLGIAFLDLAFMSWWVFAGSGKQLNERLALVEKRVDLLTGQEGYSSELGDEVLVNKAAAEAVKNLKPELEAMQQRAEPTPIEDVLGITDETREYFVPMGTGSTNKTEWSDVLSLQATINGDRYGQIVAVYFEASMRAVNGKVEARLLDRTSASVMHESNIELQGNEYAWVISKPFAVTPGGKTFMVQMRSSSGEEVSINGARLRIVATQK